MTIIAITATLLLGLEAPAYMTVSWYGPGFHGQIMASGEVFDKNHPLAAHQQLPFGTVIRLRNPQNGKICHVQIMDRGPFIPGRDLDISQKAAEILGIKDRGVVELAAEIVFVPQ